MQQTPDEWALPVWEGSDTYGLAGNTVALQPQFANAVSAALTQAKTAAAPQTISDATTTDANALGSGTYHIPFMSTAQQVSNLPVTWPGTLVTHGTGSVRVQLFMPAYVGNTSTNGSDHALLYARRTNQSGGWHSWVRLNPTQGREGDLRLMDLRHRVGPVWVTTPATVSIIMDHGLTNVESKVLPLMRARNLRATLAINSGKWADADNAGATQAEVATWGDVFEFANHGRDHLLTGNPAHDVAEVEGGREDLEAQLGVPVDTYVQTGNGAAGSYDFDDGRTAQAYWETDTGRVIARTHAVWTGLVSHPTKRYPVDGRPKNGAHGFWIDQATTTAQAQVESAISEGTGVIIRLHPQFLDQAGYLTTAQLTAFLDFLVARRNAGEVTVLPFREWSIAERADDSAPGVFVAKDELVVNVLDHGVTGDGTTDDTAALNAAAALALASDARLFMPPGTYRTTGTVTVRTHLDADQATINYFGTGTALQVGGGPGVVTFRKRLHLPRVTYGNAGNWDGTSVGVKVVNLNTCELHVPYVESFETNLLVTGETGGCVHNTITLGQLGQGHKNLVLTQNEGGWANSNTFIGGRLVHANARGAFKDDPNASQISLVQGSTTTSGPNGNTFVGTSLEGENWAYYRVTFDGARHNTFLNCRWEVMVDAGPRVRYINGATDNRIVGGYDSGKIIEEFDTVSAGGAILDFLGGQVKATIPSSTQSIPNNTWTVVNVWNVGTPRRLTYTAGTGVFKPRPGRWLITATITFKPNATGRRRASLYASSGQTIDFGEVPGNSSRQSIKLTGAHRFSGTETFEVRVDQNSGAALELEGTTGYVILQAEMLSV